MSLDKQSARPQRHSGVGERLIRYGVLELILAIKVVQQSAWRDEVEGMVRHAAAKTKIAAISTASLLEVSRCRNWRNITWRQCRIGGMSRSVAGAIPWTRNEHLIKSYVSGMA